MRDETLKEIISNDILCNKSQRVTKSYLKIFRKLQWYRKENKKCRAFIYKIILKTIYKYLNNDISENAYIGSGLRMPHPHGIVVSPYAHIGENVTIYHQVTIGANEHKVNYKNAPTIGNNVYIGAGAKLIGDIQIEDNVVIGAGAVVTKDVRGGLTVVGYNRQMLLKHEREL